MVLEKSLGQLDKLLDLGGLESGSKHLLIDTVEQITEVLADEAYFKLGLNQFSQAQSGRFYEYILDEITEIPAWAQDDRIRALLNGIFVSVQSQAKPIRIPNNIVFSALQTYMQEMRNHELWFRPLVLESEKEVMPITYCLEWVFQLIFTQPFGIRIHLLKEAVFEKMLCYCIDLNQRRGISITNMDDTALRLNEQINEVAAGMQRIDDFIANLA